MTGLTMSPATRGRACCKHEQMLRQQYPQLHKAGLPCVADIDADHAEGTQPAL